MGDRAHAVFFADGPDIPAVIATSALIGVPVALLPAVIGARSLDTGTLITYLACLLFAFAIWVAATFISGLADRRTGNWL